MLHRLMTASLMAISCALAGCSAIDAPDAPAAGHSFSECGGGICDEAEKGICGDDCHLVRYLCDALPDTYRNLETYVPGTPLTNFCVAEPQTGIIFIPGDRGYGTLRGLVQDEKGNPVADATVYIVKERPDYPMAKTDGAGHFTMKLPAASSRYVVKAEKEGYITNGKGGFEIWDQEESTVTITLLSNKIADVEIYREKILITRLVITHVDGGDVVHQPDDAAVIDLSLYPERVMPYLEEGIFSNVNHPAVQKVAQEILESVSLEQRHMSTAVARAVYTWKIKNVNQDVGKNFKDDYSAGGLITSNSGVWAKNFEDWVFMAHESIAQRRSICIGGERLSVALLRALGVPARMTPLMQHPVTQWWVQPADGSDGYWANFETSGGNIEYNKDHDNTSTLFPSRKDSELTTIPIDGDKTPLAHTLELANETWFVEVMSNGSYTNLEGVGDELQRLRDDFQRDGSPKLARFWGQSPDTPEMEDYYHVTNVGVEFNLANLGNQRIINTRFPLPNSSRHRLCDLDSLAMGSIPCMPAAESAGNLVDHYTNHPEWVVNSRTVTEQNSITGLTMKFLEVQFDLTRTCATRADCAEDRECTAGICTLNESPPGEGGCGDQICDELEQKNPQLCPADCS